MSINIRNKQNLFIKTEIDQENFTNYPANLDQMKKTQSAKNSNDNKKFVFSKKRNRQSLKVSKQEKIDLLEKKNEQLQGWLETLKTGAISAIEQKDEIIEKLRKLFNEAKDENSYDREDERAAQLQKVLQYVKDLEDERTELKKQVERQRALYGQEIYEKQEIINQLHNELNQSAEKIDYLQNYDNLLIQKIKVIEQSNGNLFTLLNQSQQNLKNEVKKNNEQKQLHKNQSSSSIMQCASISENQSIANSRKKSCYFFNAEDSININRSFDQSIIETKIQQLKTQHQLEIQDLTDFYQSRLDTLKKVCEQYPQLQFDSTNTNSQKKYQVNILTQTDNKSNYSNFTNQIEEKLYNQNQSKIIKKNLSLGSLKSIGPICMDTIDQKEQIEVQGMSLKKELLNFETIKPLNRINSSGSIGIDSESSKYEKQSKFSHKYFEYEKSNFARNSSFRKRQSSQIGTPTKIQNKCWKQQKGNEKLETQIWDKAFWFTSGTIVGGLILSMSYKMFK